MIFPVGAYRVATLVLGAAAAMRRLHYTERSGWGLLSGLVPLIGAIVRPVVMMHDSEPGRYRYGASLKGATA
ncbi:MAG: DUF805 domain-containing protein [Deltaproteobacteria bacterium]|nr:MAG: DUF805 domain-containing protein [Deltaproteobacteria bacterium]